jgi:hypothetical protein
MVLFRDNAVSRLVWVWLKRVRRIITGDVALAATISLSISMASASSWKTHPFSSNVLPRSGFHSLTRRLILLYFVFSFKKIPVINPEQPVPMQISFNGFR